MPVGNSLFLEWRAKISLQINPTGYVLFQVEKKSGYQTDGLISSKISFRNMIPVNSDQPTLLPGSRFKRYNTVSKLPEHLAVSFFSNWKLIVLSGHCTIPLAVLSHHYSKSSLFDELAYTLWACVHHDADHMVSRLGFTQGGRHWVVEIPIPCLHVFALTITPRLRSCRWYMSRHSLWSHFFTIGDLRMGLSTCYLL